jgi:hypothetical protein
MQEHRACGKQRGGTGTVSSDEGHGVPRLTFGSVEPNPTGVDGETSRWSVNPVGAPNVRLAPSVYLTLRGKAPRVIVAGGGNLVHVDSS